jgi:tetratricopeptide (TPR) repeat protein
MGHYLLLIGYDDNQQAFISQDSYLGPNRIYTYDHISRFWRHFNRIYIVLYDYAREVELSTLLGSDADEWQNTINALETARDEAVANPKDPFAWFNMGSNFVRLSMYQEAAIAYDQARNVGGGLPWRMLWYQFGTYEAYNAVGRYNDTLALAHTLLNDPGTAQYIEETFYYSGVAREGLGERDQALENYNQALYLNPNFMPASEARDRLLASND